MKGNWDTLIYIALSVIIFAISAMRKKKKRVSALGKVEGVNQKQDIFDLLSGSQFYENRPDMQTESKVVQTNEAEIENTEQVNMPVSDDKVSTETKAIPDLYEEQSKTEDIEWDDFDLRQAVIYSEILNRKPF